MTSNEIPTWGQIDRSIRQLKDFEQENTLLPETLTGAVERLVRIYDAVRPLLTMLALAPFLPPSWRKVIGALSSALAAVAAGADAGSAEFKAVKDL